MCKSHELEFIVRNAHRHCNSRDDSGQISAVGNKNHDSMPLTNCFRYVQKGAFQEGTHIVEPIAEKNMEIKGETYSETLCVIKLPLYKYICLAQKYTIIPSNSIYFAQFPTQI